MFCTGGPRRIDYPTLILTLHTTAKRERVQIDLSRNVRTLVRKLEQRAFANGDRYYR